MNFEEFLTQWSLVISVSAIIIGAIVVRVLLRIATKRAVKTIVAGVNRAQKDDRLDAVMVEQRLAQRTKTIASVLDNFTTWAITITALVMVLSEFGVNVGALIAVSTVLGVQSALARSHLSRTCSAESSSSSRINMAWATGWILMAFPVRLRELAFG